MLPNDITAASEMTAVALGGRGNALTGTCEAGLASSISWFTTPFILGVAIS